MTETDEIPTRRHLETPNAGRYADIFKKYDFYHVIEVEPGVFTPGIPLFVPGQKVVLDAMKKVPIEGQRVLDIGCRDGLFSFVAEKMGAKEVIGIDNNLSQAATDFFIPHFKSAVKMVEMNLYDLSPDRFGLFDVVLFPGVLYHLRYPVWGLKKILSVIRDGGFLIVETGILDGLEDHALLYCPVGAESPYEGTSITFFNVKGLTDTLYSIGATTREVMRLEPRATEERGYRQTAPPSSGLRALLKGLFGRSAAPPELPSRPVLPEKMPVNRGTFVCQVTRDVINPVCAKYWDLTHSFHSKGEF